MKKLIVGMTILFVFLLIGCRNTSNSDGQESSYIQADSSSILESESDIEFTVETETKFQPESNITTEVDSSVEDESETETKADHTHIYAESIENATCETDGTMTYMCECGHSYTEKIQSLGHVWGEYVFDDNATYTKDATQTAICEKCKNKDVKVVNGTKLQYTYDELKVTMYVTETANIRDLPSSDGKKLGKLYENYVITITGQCRETKWYRFEYKGKEAYISDKYCKTELECKGYITRYSTGETIIYEKPDTNSKIIDKCKSFESLILYPCEYEGWYIYKSYQNTDGDSWIENIAYVKNQQLLTYEEVKAVLNEGIEVEIYEKLACVSEPIKYVHNFITTVSSSELNFACVHIRGQHNIVSLDVERACKNARRSAEERWYDENPIFAYYFDDGTIIISSHDFWSVSMTKEEFYNSPYKDKLHVYETFEDYDQAFEQYVIDDVYAILNSSTK